MEIAEGASVPALGLSNKAVYVGSETRADRDEKNGDMCSESYFSPQHLSGPFLKNTESN